MRTSNNSISFPNFKIKKSKNLLGDKAFWLDLHGSSFTPIASTEKQALHFAEQLEHAAAWITYHSAEYFLHKKKSNPLHPPARGQG